MKKILILSAILCFVLLGLIEGIEFIFTDGKDLFDNKGEPGYYILAYLVSFGFIFTNNKE